MKYIYFVSPNENSFTVYKMEVDDDFNPTTSIRTGYNDPYEMRSQYLYKPWWSDDFEDIKKILEERKQKRVAKVYEAMVEIMQETFDEERAVEHDGRICPL